MYGLGVPPASARRPEWMDDGACLEHPDVEFVPANARTEANGDQARAICSRCLCRDECRAYAGPIRPSSAYGAGRSRPNAGSCGGGPRRERSRTGHKKWRNGCH